MSALVTIGIPCFNNAQSLHKAIESALTQTWPNCEVIVADNGSNDTSRLIASAFGERVDIITARPRGGNYARNEILRRASGEWVQFLDADDYLQPEKIAQQLDEADGGEAADVIYSPVIIETTNDGGAKRSVSEIDTSADLWTRWITWQLPQTGGALWRRSALEALGGWRVDQPCCQEHELYLRALKAGLRFVFAPTPGAVYRIWSEETLCRKNPRQVVHVKTALFDDLRAWLEKKNTWREVHQRAMGQVCFEMARTLAKQDLAEAARYHRDRKKRGLIRPEGPAAPQSYALAYRALGFSLAELVARALRRKSPSL